MDQISSDSQSYIDKSQEKQESNVNDERSFQRIDLQSLEDLKKAKQRFNIFLKTLGHLKQTKLQQNIADCCFFGQKKTKKMDINIKYGFITSAIEMRIENMFKTKRIKKNWGQNDLKILIWMVSKVCELHKLNNAEKQFNQRQWTIVASVIPGTTPQSCKFRWLNLKINNLASHHWTKQEKRLLRDIVEARLASHGSHYIIKDWKTISEQLYNRNQSSAKCYRNAKQCKQQWFCYLSPQIKKGPWNIGQDLTLLANIAKSKGNKRWCELVRLLKGRTENAIKNRFTLLLEKQRKLHRYKYMSQVELISEILNKHQDYLQNCNDQKQDEGVSSSQVHSSIRNDNHQYFQRSEVNKFELSTDPLNQFNKNGQIRQEKLNFDQFKEIKWNYSFLEPGLLNSSCQFIKFEDQNKEKLISYDKISENYHQEQYCIVQSLSFIFQQCFN